MAIAPLQITKAGSAANAFDFSPLANLGRLSSPQDTMLANLAQRYGVSPNAAPSTAPSAARAPFDNQTDLMANYGGAISNIESGGKYDLLGPTTKTGDQAIGKYQVMASNVPEWTRAALGTSMTPDQFRSSPAAQDAVFKDRFGQYVQKYGPEGAAKAWFAGEGGMNNPNATDQLGTSVAEYGRRFQAGLGKY